MRPRYPRQKSPMTKSLWAFALALYARPGVAAACLQWQRDFAADVNVLLAAAWLASRGHRWPRADVAALCADCHTWRTQALLPLRATRRALAGSALYEALKGVELA